MRRFNQWLLTAPLSVHFAVSAVIFGSVTYGLDAGLFDHPDSWIEHLISAVAYGAFMTWFVARRRRKDGGASQQRAFVTALKSGELPADADPAVWGPLLDRKQRSIRRWQPWAVVEFAVFMALAIVLALVQGPIWWAFAACFAAFGIAILVGGRRNRRRLTGLQGQLARNQQHPA